MTCVAELPSRGRTPTPFLYSTFLSLHLLLVESTSFLLNQRRQWCPLLPHAGPALSFHRSLGFDFAEVELPYLVLHLLLFSLIEAIFQHHHKLLLPYFLRFIPVVQEKDRCWRVRRSGESCESCCPSSNIAPVLLFLLLQQFMLE